MQANRQAKLTAVVLCLVGTIGCGQITQDTTAGKIPGVQPPSRFGGLVAFWNFQETAGSVRNTQTAPGSGAAYPLIEVNGPVARVGSDKPDDPAAGVFGPYAARLAEGQGFRLPREALGGLNFAGKEATFTVVIWVRRARKSNPAEPEHLVGVWNPSNDQRRLALQILNDQFTVQLCPAESAGKPEEVVRLVGSPVPMGSWTALAATCDGFTLRLYRDGLPDTVGGVNSLSHTGGLLVGEGADFTVGLTASVDAVSGRSVFVGDIGGLAVYNRSLTDQEIAALSKPLGR